MYSMKTLAMGHISTALLILGTGAAIAADEPKECLGTLVSAKGKILNNALSPGDTLGVVHLKLKATPEKIKMKCGVHGIAYFGDQDPTNPLSFLPRFTHRIVCNDTVAVPGTNDTIHSQAILDSHFAQYIPGQDCGNSTNAASFKEISFPQSGRGVFAEKGGGALEIEGEVLCSGAINMKFSGQVCLKQ